jgi:hypothetical protein
MNRGYRERYIMASRQAGEAPKKKLKKKLKKAWRTRGGTGVRPSWGLRS